MNWNDIEPTEQAWSSALKQLLDKAAVAARGSERDRETAIAALTDFIAAVPLSMIALEDLAKQAAHDLIDTNVAAALHRLIQRTSALDTHIAALGGSDAQPDSESQ